MELVDKLKTGILLTSLGLVTSCANKINEITYIPRVEPLSGEMQIQHDGPGRQSFAYCTGSISGTAYKQDITSKDKKKGYVELPNLTLIKEGFHPHTLNPGRVELPTEFNCWHNLYTINLEPDKSYKGSSTNKIKLALNSEPYGARIYQEGELMCTTPCLLDYSLGPNDYSAGKMSAKSLLAFKEGHLPQEQKLTLNLKDKWKYRQDETYDFATLFILPFDPSYRPPAPAPEIRQTQDPQAPEHSRVDQNITITRTESDLDKILKGLNIISIGKTLSAMSKK